MTILLVLEEQEKAEDKTWDLKKALATRDEFDPKKLFPEYFPEKEKKQEDDGSGITPEDYKDVKWSSPSDDPEGWEAIQRLLAEGGGTFSGEEVVEMPNTEEIDWTDWQ
jgi:hypothetical protein